MKVDIRLFSVLALALIMLLGTLSLPVSAEPMEGEWDGGQALQISMNNGFDPWVAQSSNGNKIVVWIETDPTPNYFLCFSMYTPMTGWSWPEVLAGNWGGNVMSNPQVGMSDNGSAVVSWISYIWEYHVYSRTYVTGIGWGDTFDHGQTASINSKEYRLSVNGNGDAILAHESVNSTERSVNVWAYQAGSGWDASPAVLETVPLATDLYYVKAVLGDSGRAAAVWQSIDSNYRVMVSTRSAEGVWGTPEEIDDAGMWEFSTRVGIDDSTGEFMVTYRKNMAPYYNTYYSVTEGGVWSTPMPVAGVTESDCWNHNMVMNRAGVAIVVTTEYVNPGYNVNATMYVDGEWTTPTPIATNLTGLYYPEVAIDDLGRAVVSFTIDEDRVVSIYTPGDGWTEPEAVETNALGSTYNLGSISLESDSILVGYSSSYGIGTIWASLFEAPDTTPPTLLVDQATTAETDRPLFEISGTTEPGAVVDVNGRSIAVSESGNFSVLVELEDGANVLVITAKDEAGNSANVSLTVSYTDPVPGLQDQIDEQQNILNQTQEDLDAANDEIASVGSTAMLMGILGVVGLIVAVVALVMVFLRRKG